MQPAAAAQGSGAPACLIFEPTAAEWAGTLNEFVERVASRAPGGMFRVRPPAGWAPSALPLAAEELDALTIEHPIRQNVRGVAVLAAALAASAGVLTCHC